MQIGWLLANWKLLLGGAMLATIAALLFVIGQKNDAIEAKRNELAACEAEREVQNARIREMEAEGERMRAEVEAARERGLRNIEQARVEKRKLERIAPIGCPTPSEVKAADI